jgi:hypothetical protein
MGHENKSTAIGVLLQTVSGLESAIGAPLQTVSGLGE